MAKLKLHAVNHGKDKNRYCGPSAISAVTKLTSGEAARLIRKQSGKRSVKGTSTSNIRRALEACNIHMNFVRSPEGTRYGRSDGITLARWLKLTTRSRGSKIFLIVAGHHWQLVSGRRYVCGLTEDIVSIRDKKVKRRARVAEVYELTSDNVTLPSLDVSKPKPKASSTRYQCKKIVKQYPQFDFRIEAENYSGEPDGWFWWVQMSDELEDKAVALEHELHDCHSCYCWDEVLDRLQRMVEFGKQYKRNDHPE
tara:strand:- start:15 stop:773 length:759 start_codon:yes stop_codon:yes gene_type:complete